MKQESVSPRGAVEYVSTAPRVRSLATLAKTGYGKCILACIAGGICFLIGRWVWDDGAPSQLDREAVSPLQIENLKSFVVRKDGKKYWEIAAEKVELSPHNEMTVARNVSKGTFFRDGKPFLTLHSPTVRLSNHTNNLAATGGVQVKGANGFSFSTAQTLWIHRTRTVECPKPVTVKLRGMTFLAPQLLYNWKNGILSCDKPVEVRAPGATLRAKQFEANTKKRVLELKGGAEFVFDPRQARPQQFHDLLQP